MASLRALPIFSPSGRLSSVAKRAGGLSPIWWTHLKRAILRQEVCHVTTTTLHETIQKILLNVVGCPYGQKTRTRCFSRIYLTTLALPSHLSRPTRSRTLYQKEGHHQGKGNEFLRPLVGQEAVGTISIRFWERLGRLLKCYSREFA